MNWNVTVKTNVNKQLDKLPNKVRLILQLLLEELSIKGPFPGSNWPNYSKLRTGKNIDKRHCHLIKGKPTYVAYWEILDKAKKQIEVLFWSSKNGHIV